MATSNPVRGAHELRTLTAIAPDFCFSAKATKKAPLARGLSFGFKRALTAPSLSWFGCCGLR